MEIMLFACSFAALFYATAFTLIYFFVADVVCMK